MAYEFLKDLGKSLLPAIVAGGSALILNHQAVQKAKGEANLIKEESDKAYATAMLQQQNLQLMKDASKAPPKEEKSNLPLYIGLGVGGVVLVGIVIFAVTRK